MEWNTPRESLHDDKSNSRIVPVKISVCGKLRKLSEQRSYQPRPARKLFTRNIRFNFTCATEIVQAFPALILDDSTLSTGAVAVNDGQNLDSFNFRSLNLPLKSFYSRIYNRTPSLQIYDFMKDAYLLFVFQLPFSTAEPAFSASRLSFITADGTNRHNNPPFPGTCPEKPASAGVFFSYIIFYVRCEHVPSGEGAE